MHVICAVRNVCVLTNKFHVSHLQVNGSVVDLTVTCISDSGQSSMDIVLGAARLSLVVPKVQGLESTHELSLVRDSGNMVRTRQEFGERERLVLAWWEVIVSVNILTRNTTVESHMTPSPVLLESSEVPSIYSLTGEFPLQ